MTKTQAIKKARNQVTSIYAFGNNYRFNYFDESMNCWCESNPSNYHSVLFHRSQELIYRTCQLMGLSYDQCCHKMYQYSVGRWVTYI